MPMYGFDVKKLQGLTAALIANWSVAVAPPSGEVKTGYDSNLSEAYEDITSDTKRTFCHCNNLIAVKFPILFALVRITLACADREISVCLNLGYLKSFIRGAIVFQLVFFNCIFEIRDVTRLVRRLIMFRK